MTNHQIWPDLLYIVRHGESAGNVAREAAMLAGDHTIDLAVRDVDVPLSKLGDEQSRRLAAGFGTAAGEKPNVI